MAEKLRKANNGVVPRNQTTPQQQSRLQRRRPASLQISPASASQWNVAIPLLSPLASSPTAGERYAPEMRSREDQSQQRMITQEASSSSSSSAAAVFKKWQHLAAPFCNDSAPLKPSFLFSV